MPHAYSITEKLLFPATPLAKQRCATQFAGKRVIITGASYGIGEELAHLLGSFGARLVLIARTEDKLKQVCQSITGKGGSAVLYALDLRDEKATDLLIETLKASGESIDYLIHCAGLSIRRSFRDSMDRFHDVQRTMAINYFAPVKLSMALFPQLQRVSGQIIYLSAINTLFPSFPKWSAYQASKSAFNEWFLGVSAEMTELNVAATLVYLPLVKTRMIAPTKQYDKAPAMSPEHAAAWIIKAMLSRQQIVQPWWTIFAVFSTKLLRSVIRSHILNKQ